MTQTTFAQDIVCPTFTGRWRPSRRELALWGIGGVLWTPAALPIYIGLRAAIGFTADQSNVLLLVFGALVLWFAGRRHVRCMVVTIIGAATFFLAGFVFVMLLLAQGNTIV